MKTVKRQQFAILFDFFRRRKLLVFSVLMIFLVSSAASIVAPLFLGKVIDQFRTGDRINLAAMLKGSKGFMIIFTVLIMIQVFSGILLAYLKKESVIHYQKMIFDQILKLPYLQLIKFRTAYLQSRWGSDSLNLSSFYGDNLFELIKNFFIVVLGVVAAISISPTFSLSILIFIFVTGVSTWFVSRYLVRQLKTYLEKFSTLTGKVNETIAGIFELKIMGFINSFKKRIASDIGSTSNQHYSIQLKGLIIFSFINALVFAGFFGILLYFGYLLTTNKLTVGNAVAYMAISFFVIKSLTNLISRVSKLNTTFASLKRTVELVNLSVSALRLAPLPAGGETKRIDTVADIELKNVWFRYDRTKDYVIRDFSYKFARGKVYALSGRSGIGKSTLIRLLMGVMPPGRGAVLINGEPLNSRNIPDFWKRLGYLSQDPFLFKGSLIENLVPADNGLEEDIDKIKHALTDAGIDRLDVSQEVTVEEGGKNFSGGEKRRLSLARAFIKDAEVLILDEPTSQVDKAAEEIILNSIVNFARKGRIVIIIAHGDLALQRADEEINLEDFKDLPEPAAEADPAKLQVFKEVV